MKIKFEKRDIFPLGFRCSNDWMLADDLRWISHFCNHFDRARKTQAKWIFANFYACFGMTNSFHFNNFCFTLILLFASSWKAEYGANAKMKACVCVRVSGVRYKFINRKLTQKNAYLFIGYKSLLLLNSISSFYASFICFANYYGSKACVIAHRPNSGSFILAFFLFCLHICWCSSLLNAFPLPSQFLCRLWISFLSSSIQKRW